jgi:hypothetical protein
MCSQPSGAAWPGIPTAIDRRPDRLCLIRRIMAHPAIIGLLPSRATTMLRKKVRMSGLSCVTLFRAKNAGTRCRQGEMRMIVGSDGVEADSPNHPLAVRMAVIALLMQNIGIGCMWGSYSVLLSAVEMRLGVTRELSALAVPVVTLATAGCAPIVGMIVTRYSLRMLMLVGAVLSFAG